MAAVADLYGVLGVPEGADADAIKKAYRELAKRYHPDANPGDAKAEERFKELGQAYEILSDPEKRRRYDAMRHAPAREAWGGTGESGSPWQGEGSIEDLFSMFFGGQGGPFGTASPMGAGNGDLESEVWVSFEDAALGRSVTVQWAGRDQPLRLNLPPGAESGLRLRLAGQGSARRRGRRGDLYLTLKVRPSDRFTRQGLDIIGPLDANLGQCLLGGRVAAPTLRGEARVRVPAGTQPGTRLRLAGQGIEAGGRRGDHYAEVRLQLPQDLDNGEKAAIRDMARRRGWQIEDP